MLHPFAMHHPRLWDFTPPHEGPWGLGPHLCCSGSISPRQRSCLFCFSPAKLRLIPLLSTSQLLSSGAWWASVVKAVLFHFQQETRNVDSLALQELCCWDQSGLMSWIIYCLVHFQKQTYSSIFSFFKLCSVNLFP